jgi:hypothetical protein
VNREVVLTEAVGVQEDVRATGEMPGEMLELCPREQEDNKFFLFLFLQQLPREIRVLLDE